MVHFVRAVIFFGFVGLGFWGLSALPSPWNWIAVVAAFLVGGSASMIVFKRLATPDQIKADLESRLHND